MIYMQLMLALSLQSVPMNVQTALLACKIKQLNPVLIKQSA